MPQFSFLSETCRSALAEFYRNVDALSENLVEDLATAILQLDEIKNDLAAVRGFVEERLVDAMADDPEVVVDGVTFEKRRSDTRKAWAHKDIAAEVAERLTQSAVDFETGEVLRTPEDLLREMVEYAGISYWKVGALKKLGIVADDYCEVTEGSMKIRIHRP